MTANRKRLLVAQAITPAGWALLENRPDIEAVRYDSAMPDEAYRALRPGGLLALASLTPGSTPPSRALAGLWKGLWRIDPRVVGGCRPVELAALIAPERWRVCDRLTVTRSALSSEVLIAERL